MDKFKRKEDSKIEAIEETKVESISAENLVSDVPPVTTVDPNAADSMEEPKEGEDAKLVDDLGVVFDPEIHAVDKEGNPKKGVKNQFIKKRGPKGGKREHTSGLVDGRFDKAEIEAVSEGYFSAFKALGSSFLGEEFSEHTKEEGEYVKKSIEAVCLESGSTGLSPKQSLALALSLYTAPRLSNQTAKERLGVFFSRIKNFFTKKKKSKEEKANRNQTIREPVDEYNV